MKVDAHRAAQLITTALIVTAITQMIYVLLSGGGKSHVAYPIWRIEALSALVVALFSFIIAGRNALVGGCLAVGGVFNLIQTGMGLTMFYQLGYGGDAAPNPVFIPVLRMSFFLYFAAKAALGVAAIMLGIELWQTVTAGLWRIVGLLCRSWRAAAQCRRHDDGTGRGALRGCGRRRCGTLYRACADPSDEAGRSRTGALTDASLPSSARARTSRSRRQRSVRPTAHET